MTTYTYDAANRLINAGGVAHIWDANGNLLNDGSRVYAYDSANRLISTTLSGVNTQFGYNGDGIRLRLVEAGTLTTYTQDYAAPLPVVLQAKTGSAATQYVYSLDTRPLAEYEAAAWEYLLADPLGSVRQIADNSGNVTLLKSYEPYGSVLNSQGSATSIFGYSGEQIDSTGLIFLRARYMQPRLGVFLSHDEWIGTGPRPASLNGWNYVEGNPISFKDPSGLCAQLFGWNDSEGLFTRENCDRLEAGDLAFTKWWYGQLADHFESAEGWTETAANFRRYLDGTGAPRQLSSAFVRDDIIGAMSSVRGSLSSLFEWYIAKEFDDLETCTPTAVGPDGFARGFRPNYSQATFPGNVLFGGGELHVASALGEFRMDVVLAGELHKLDNWWISADLDVHVVVLDYYDWHPGLWVQYYDNIIMDEWAFRLREVGARPFYVRGDYRYQYTGGARRYILGWPDKAKPWGEWVRSSKIGRGFDPEDDGIDYTGEPYQ